MDLKLNADRFTGDKYISTYHQFRPSPPKEILQLAIQYLGYSEDLNVVDLGCGSGLSTVVWKEFATKITGIDPSYEMIEFAYKRSQDSNIMFKQGYSHAIPLSSESIDIISCSQAFHWMEPTETLNEVNRLLNESGVFVIYDVIWPPSVNTIYETAYNDLFHNVGNKTELLKENIAVRWDKNEHYRRILESNYFRFVKETYFHKSEQSSKDRLIGIALSQGGLEALLRRGFSADEIGLDNFIEVVKKLENLPAKTIYNYRVIYAVK